MGAMAPGQQQAAPQAAAAAPAAAAGAAAAGGTVQCPGCSATVPAGKFCAECGTSLSPQPKFCPSCGAQGAPGEDLPVRGKMAQHHALVTQVLVGIDHSPAELHSLYLARAHASTRLMPVPHAPG